MKKAKKKKFLLWLKGHDISLFYHSYLCVSLNLVIKFFFQCAI